MSISIHNIDCIQQMRTGEVTPLTKLPMLEAVKGPWFVIHAYIHTYMHTYIHICIHTYITSNNRVVSP